MHVATPCCREQIHCGHSKHDYLPIGVALGKSLTADICWREDLGPSVEVADFVKLIGRKVRAAQQQGNNAVPSPQRKEILMSVLDKQRNHESTQGSSVRSGVIQRGLVEQVGDPVWRNQRVAFAAAAALVSAAGVVFGWLTPRGPLTSNAALTSMIVCLLVGVGAGFLSRSRLAIGFAPALFALIFEITRLGAKGPTVDALHLRSTYGVLALVVGRLFHGLLALAPMSLGAVIGAAVARRAVIDLTTRKTSFGRSSGERRDGANPKGLPSWVGQLGLYARRGVAIVTSLALGALAVGIARPARTAPIRDAKGDRVAGSIAELTKVKIGGHDLSMMIRGTKATNPLMLFLAGGPGGSELGAMRKYLSSLEEDFLVVTWDQRGTGKSYAQIEPTSTLSFDNAVKDTIEVTNYLRKRFNQERVVLVGQSYGSTLGVRAVQQHPELYAAFVGAGQMVSQRETDVLFYEDTLSWARRNGKKDLIDKLQKIGPPPYKNLLDYESSLGYEHEVSPYDHRPNAEGEGGFSENFFEPEYSLVEQVHLLGGFLDTFNFIYPQLQNVDFRRDATKLEVPVYVAMGAHEARGRAEPAREWFDLLQAPSKELVTFQTSGHRPLFEQPKEFASFMTDTVLAELISSGRVTAGNAPRE
jgi:proline iminopeptidase